MASNVDFADWLAISNLMFNWVTACDTKDWKLLQSCVAPAMTVDLSVVDAPIQENITPEAFSAIFSDRNMIGDPRVKTNHLPGASEWTKLEADKIRVKWQMRAAHKRFKTEDQAETVGTFYTYGVVHYTYHKIDGAWKVVRFAPTWQWTEGDLVATITDPDSK